MDPASDPPPLPDQPTAAAIPAAPALNHPPYAEMITAAITALNEPSGSSKRAIAKYIETQYSGLPTTHGAMLTHHLKRLKANGLLAMVKHSYVLPRSAPPAPANGAVTPANAVAPDPSTAVPKRRPGRPPKPKPDAIQAAVPVFQPPAAVPQPNVAVGPANGPVRGRGRPPKRAGLKRGPGRPPKGGGAPKAAAAAPATAVAPPQGKKGAGRPRGRPPKPINVVVEGPPAPTVGVGLGVPRAPVAGKRRGRPPKAGNEAKKPRNVSAVQPKKPRKLSGKPLGRPKKNASATTVNRTPDSQLLVAYLDLKAKLENLQSRIRQTANFVRPSLNNEAAITALQDLELIAMTVSVPATAQAPQPQPQPPAQPEQYHQLQQPQPQPQPEN